MPRVVLLHIDVDQFLVALARREDPSLVGRPVIVGGTGDPTVPRTVCMCASYEARSAGVRAGTPLRLAGRKLPEAVFLPYDEKSCATGSAQVMAVLRELGEVEVLGWEEAFLAPTHPASHPPPTRESLTSDARVGQEGPRVGQEGPRVGQDGARVGHDGPGVGHDGPGVGHEGPGVGQDGARVGRGGAGGSAGPSAGGAPIDEADRLALARRVQETVRQRTGLVCSVGVGDTPLQAKTATGFGKPAGIGVLSTQTWLAVMGERPTAALWGIG
ncbi:Y-family DNA polymerase, partial [Pseudonocardia pini]|uniref:Y-family DNA polymerase n=1 Tax=Pseudonocardia pini TaxID=2758030 RepID=UPI00406BCE72